MTLKVLKTGVPIVDQQVKNMTQCLNPDPALPGLQASDVALIEPLVWDLPYATGVAIKRKKKVLNPNDDRLLHFIGVCVFFPP